MRALLAAACLALTALPLWAEGEKAGEFDYYVLALSWSPNWCAMEGDAKGSPQCDTSEDHGWIMHGLWPQFHRGWPSYCSSAERNPPRHLTNAMADIMGTSGLAWYQWKKHGTCSGLTGEDYYTTARQAYDSITRPQVFRKIEETVTLPAAVVEAAFLKANPKLEADMVTITCRGEFIQEARICLSKALEPVPCGRDVIKDCTQTSARFDPIR
ncbi:ribonuclease T2 [Shimia sp. R10_1]|uniref:ribonuclease T2 family protein n=1 Tax=Shimia sp. R10_1 TaxID=2821095 RepID=UPI001ADBA6D3|nr:ribonuclease T2 [Shimia sp. R10_1]MBO9474534.1 ribonuclease T2 [Shimia sp. R10_1]